MAEESYALTSHIVPISNFRAHLNDWICNSQNEPLIITVDGIPVARLEGIGYRPRFNKPQMNALGKVLTDKDGKPLPDKRLADVLNHQWDEIERIRASLMEMSPVHTRMKGSGNSTSSIMKAMDD